MVLLHTKIHAKYTFPIHLPYLSNPLFHKTATKLLLFFHIRKYFSKKVLSICGKSVTILCDFIINRSFCILCKR